MAILSRWRHRHAPPTASAPPSAQELEITAGLASLRDATARELMTPRVDVVALPAPVHLEEVAQAVRRSGHSHFPVYEQDLDHLLGILFVKDLFHLAENGHGELGEPTAGFVPGADVTGRLRDPYVVPESRSALQVLADMRVKRRGFAVVVDEYGGFAGVITINDLVSELVGDLRDEFDRNTSPAVLRIDERRFLVDGACDVDEVREEIGAPIPDGEYVTLGGFLFDAFGHVPAERERLERMGWTYEVMRMERRRIAKVVVEAPSTTLETGGEVRLPAGK